MYNDQIYDDEGLSSPEPILDSPLNNMMSSILSDSESSEENQEINLNALLRPRGVAGTSAPPKRKQANPSIWKKVVKKRLREQGKEYTNSKGKTFPAKIMKDSNCGNNCPYDCLVNFSNNLRQKIHSDFWVLTDEEKKFFYSKFVQVIPKKRQRTKSETSRRINTFKYSFQNHGEVYQVCQSFFLSTLNISKSRIYHFFKNNHNEITGSPLPSKKGKHASTKTPENKILEVKKHIELFPCIDPHYVRASSQKQYLEAGLNLKKMYDIYKNNTENPLKFCMYRKVFNTEYNIAFYKPKKDLCDICTKFNNIKSPCDAVKAEFYKHKLFNEKAKARRQSDRELKDKNIAVISYDLQSVFTLPRSNISNFYYKRKFIMYNLTGLCSLNKLTYCSLWYETQSGRSGNDIASALVKILQAVIYDNPGITKIILWSDACIPQNRNRITSLALLKFLENNPQIKEIYQRYSSGHSRIQELDAVHSVIDRHLKHISYFSPVSLMRQLNLMNYDNVKLKLMQLKAKDFFNYSIASAGLNFIPYSKAKEIEYRSNDLVSIGYREDYGTDINLQLVPLFGNKTRNTHLNQKTLPRVGNTPGTSILSKDKKKDIESMYYWMPEEDVQFYKAVLK